MMIRWLLHGLMTLKERLMSWEEMLCSSLLFMLKSKSRPVESAESHAALKWSRWRMFVSRFVQNLLYFYIHKKLVVSRFIPHLISF